MIYLPVELDDNKKEMNFLAATHFARFLSLTSQPAARLFAREKKYSHSIANVWRNQHITIVIIVRVYQSTPVQWIVAAVAVAVAAAAARPGMSVARTFDKFFQIVCVWA